MDSLDAVEQPSTGSTETPLQQIERDFSQEARQSELIDLDKAEKFMFEGKEWTPKELKSAYMAHADYTKKTQALAQDRKFMENLEADLDAIKQDPSLAEEFKRVYPQAYHKYLKFAVGEARTQQQSQAATLPPEISEMKTQFQQMQEYFNKMQMEQLENQFANIYTSQIKDKFKFVDEDRLAGLAREALQMGYKLRGDDGKLDASMLEQIAKFENERIEKKFQAYQKETMEKQRAASKTARDIGPGGGVPGSAPKKLSFKEATEAAIRDLSSRQ